MREKPHVLLCVAIFLMGSITMYSANKPIESGKNLWAAEMLNDLISSDDTISLSRLLGENRPKEQFQFSTVDALIHRDMMSTAIPEDNMDDVYKKTAEYYGNPKVQEAKRYVDGITSSRLIELLSGIETVKFPVGIKDSIKGYVYTIVFASAKLYPEYAEIKVFGGIQKHGEADLLFGSDNIKFSYEGGIIGDATLGLFSDFPVKRDGKKLAFVFNAFQESGNGNHQGTYLTFDCGGFVSARVDWDVIISRDWILPTDSEGKVKLGEERVTAKVALTATDLNDLVVEASVPHFTLTKDTSISFLVGNAIVDFSDQKNGVSFIPPPLYDENTGEIAYGSSDIETENLWKGVYFNTLEVVLPETFEQDGGKSLSFGAEALYIDSKGVTGKFYGDDVLPIETGKLGETGWAFGIDHVEIDLIYSQVYGFGFDGSVSIPIGETDKGLRYGAIANTATETYNFNIGIDSTMVIPMWDVSSVVLSRGSALNITVEDKKWKAQAVLSGIMEINVIATEEKKNTDLKIAGINFDKLLVNSYAPYVSLHPQGGHISFSVGPLLNNAFINIDHATLLQQEDDKVMFALGMEAGVMSQDDGGAKVGGSFGIVGKPVVNNGKQSWEFDEIRLMSLEVHLEFGQAGYIKGGITLFSGDPVYGNGFHGYLEGGFVQDGSRYKFSATASARFGTMNEATNDEYKYWSFDVYVSSSAVSIPLYPPLAANGFGGGMYHHMSMAGYDLDAMADNGLNNPYSGIIYEPDPNTRLGLKATIGLTTTSGKAFQGVVTLELAFNQNLGLREIRLYGTGEISGSDSEGWSKKQKDDISSNVLDSGDAEALNATDAKGKPNTITCAVMLRISLEGGFEMHGAFKVYLQAGEGKIRGEGALDLLASTKSNRWHFYLGGYTDNSITNIENVIIPPVSVSVDFEAFSVNAGLYLMFGNDLPGPPPISPQVASFFKIPRSTNNRDLLNSGGRSASMGTASAFGSYAALSFTYKVANEGYLDVEGGAGFDLCMLSNSDTSRCSVASNYPQGQKGWRALGRLYIYAKVGGSWKRDKWPRIDIKIPPQYMGLLVEGDVPNPSFFDAQVRIKLFNWLNINKKIEMGNKCGEVIN